MTPRFNVREYVPVYRSLPALAFSFPTASLRGDIGATAPLLHTQVAAPQTGHSLRSRRQNPGYAPQAWLSTTKPLIIACRLTRYCGNNLAISPTISPNGYYVRITRLNAQFPARIGQSRCQYVWFMSPGLPSDKNAFTIEVSWPVPWPRKM